MNRKPEPIQGILTVLEDSNFTGTNKLGLLLALIDLAPSIKNNALPITEISRKLLEIHWSHSEPYMGSSSELRQITGNGPNITVLNEVVKLKKFLNDNNIPSVSYESDLRNIPKRVFAESVKQVSDSTWKNPVRFLQKLGGIEVAFIFTYQNRTLFFEKGAIKALITHGPILRELIQYKFTNFVLILNSGILGLNDTTNLNVQEFLFGEERHMPPDGLRNELLNLQKGTCLYTGTKLPAKGLSKIGYSLDHVIPWSRLRLSAIENFICTTKSTNSSKGNSLLGYDLLEKWANFQVDNKAGIEEIADNFGWVSDFDRVIFNLTNIYGNAPEITTSIYRGSLRAASTFVPFENKEKKDILLLLRTLVNSYE